MVMRERSKRLSAMNVYITNAPPEDVQPEHVHDLYSLRWQIELLFKTWKSFFQIDHCKEIKKERLECHLYGQLIAILLCSSTMFQMRQLLLPRKNKNSANIKPFISSKIICYYCFNRYKKAPKTYQRSCFACLPSCRKTGERLIDTRRKQSLIYWVWYMSVHRNLVLLRRIMKF